MKANMRAILIILAITYVIAFIMSPADQMSFLIEWFAYGVIALGCYYAGLVKGRTQAATSS